MPLTRRRLIQGAVAIPALARVARPPHAWAAEPLPAGGVNLAGAEFGAIPGIHGREYLYPPAAHFGYYRKLGFTLIRLPFKWERLQPELNAEFAAEEQKLLVETVRHAAEHDQSLIVDPHNYAKRRVARDGWGTEHSIGSDAVPIAAFADFWARLAVLFKDQPNIMFGLMNEPTGISVGDWLRCANAAIAAIRDTGATNLILVPGIDYSGAHSWRRLGNTAMADVKDPIRNVAFEVHQYFDQDSSGTTHDSVSGTIGAERIADFQAWARDKGIKAVLGEFNGGRNPAGANALNDLCQEMSANPDIWLGWTAWAGGPRWPEDEMFNLEPWQDGRVREQTAILAKYASPTSPTYWVADAAIADVDLSRRRAYGSAPADASDASSYRPTDALRSLLHGNASTILIEIEETATGPDWRLLRGMGAQLEWTRDGTANVPGIIQTPAQINRTVPARRRIALSVDRSQSRILLAVTGKPATQARFAVPAADDMIFSREALTRTSRLRRITGYTGFRAPEQLEALCA